MICVNLSGKALARRLPWLLLLVVLALLRAEQGTAELQGRTSGASRLFHLAPEPDGEAWAVAFLGHTARVRSRLVLLESDGPLVSRETVAALAAAAGEWRDRAIEQVEQIKEALP